MNLSMRLTNPFGLSLSKPCLSLSKGLPHDKPFDTGPSTSSVPCSGRTVALRIVANQVPA
jgi:hypothetical protein